MSTMKDLANALGVELEEEFYIYDNNKNSYCSCLYKFTENGLLWYDNGNNFWHVSDRNILEFFIGKYKISKKPWKPKKGDIYYRIGSGGNFLRSKWEEDIFDLTHFSAGNCFKTKEDAEKHKVALLNSLKRTYNDFSNKEN